MKTRLAALLALGVVAAPALAQQTKLDQAIAKADEQVQKGKPDDAVKTVTKAAAECACAEGQAALGRLQERLGNLDAAATAYQAAAAAGQSNPDVLAAVVNFTLHHGKAKDALDMARKAVAAGQTPAALAALARAQARFGDGPGALVTADKAVAAGANSAMAHVARAEALLVLHRPQEAEAEARKATELDPKSPLAYARLALALVQLKRPQEAVAAGKHATELADKFGEGFAAEGLAMIAASPQKNWSEAIAQAQQGAFLDPDDPTVLWTVGQIFEANGQVEQAANSYRNALKVDPGYGPARVALIQAELNAGHRDAAIEQAKQIPPPVPPEIDKLIGEDAARKGDWVNATPYLERAAQGLQGSAESWATLGIAYNAQRKYAEAADAFKKATDLAPNNNEYRTTYGLILGQAGKPDEGLAELRKVVNTPGYKDADGWINLGWVYRSMNKPQESIDAYQKALQLDPKQWQAALGLGWAYSYTKDYDRAITAYQQAVQVDPKLATADAALGIAWAYAFKSMSTGGKELPQAREWSAKAAAAGRNVAALNTQIDKIDDAIKRGAILDAKQQEEMQKQQQQAEEANKKIEQANAEIGSRNAASRVRGCRDMASAAGGAAVSALATLMQTDPDYDVRIACTNALGSLGAAARPAVRNLQAMLKQPPLEVGVNATAQQLDAQMKDGDYRRALRDALAKIQ
ncbi:MAG TPA: tetratricopeptide repeat protein [Vicinamibacteria bacterium]|nr:tetratricopeptide repeat protein [Vicinamibacteria bacterium]